MSELPEPYYEDEFVKIIHGDCREIMPLLKVDVVLTDAPYNGDIKYGDGTNDSKDWIDYGMWLTERIRLMERCATGPVIIYVSVPGVIELSRVYPPKWIGAWVRPTAGNPAGDNRGLLILPQWEPCLFYGNMGAFKGATPDVWLPSQLAERNGHPCPKPLALMGMMMRKIPGDVILDPFCGSGTTLRAAKDIGRKAIGIEIEERFCEITARRCSQEVLDLG